MRVGVIGAGATGLAAGCAGNFPVYEADTQPGGMSRTYLLNPGQPRRWDSGLPDPSAYRFDYGGGHWIFGLDASLKHGLSRYAELAAYERISSVFFSRRGEYGPCPIQNHLDRLGPAVAKRCLSEILNPPERDAVTQADWLEINFGPTLNSLFFAPFHERYTAGLWTRLAPQDGYKSPIDRTAVIKGAAGSPRTAGYNATFHYPVDGLSRLWAKFAQRVEVRFENLLVSIDPDKRKLTFASGEERNFDFLLSTLALHRTLDLAGLEAGPPPDPYTSVLVLNVGGRKGRGCPPDHWLYVPDSLCGLHRVGIYSNVSAGFLPAAVREKGEFASFYIERAYPAGERPGASSVDLYVREAIRELQDWDFLDEPEVMDCHWVEVAYTWSWPGSTWRQAALSLLARHGIQAIGRYGSWQFKGIADEIREGLLGGGRLL